MTHRMILTLIVLAILLTGMGCSGQNTTLPTPVTAVAEEAQPTATSLPTQTATTSPTDTPQPTTPATTTSIPSPTPTETPTMTPTPNPLTNIDFQIVFSSDEDSENTDIYVMSVNGIYKQRLTEDAFFDFTPNPSPDGQKIAFSSDREDNHLQIYIMNVDGSGITRITQNEGNDRDPAWSPDGTKLAFASDRDGDPEIFIINADGSEEHQLTNNETTDVSPVWSPDGQWIAYSSSQDATDPNIFIMSPDGSNQQRLTFSQNYDGDTVSWAPDSQWLIIPSSRIGNYELYALKIDGSEFKTITRTEGDEYSGILSPDGRYLLMNVYYEDYIGLVLRDLETQTDYQLTTDESRSSFATWLPDSEKTFDETWLETNLSSDDDVCIHAEDETYGLTAENPMPIGNGSSFGGPFDGMDAYTFLRGAKGEAQEWIRGHIFPSNENGDVMDIIFIQMEGGQKFELYVKINDYSIPQIPAGMYCDLQLP